MTDCTELKRAASASKNWGGEVGEQRWYSAECFNLPYFGAQDAEFIAACNPGSVLALIAENEALRGAGAGALRFVAFAFDEGVEGAEMAGRAIENAIGAKS